MGEESAYAKPQLRHIEGYYTGNVFCIDPDFGRAGDCSSGFTLAVTARSLFPISAAVHASSSKDRPICLPAIERIPEQRALSRS